MNSSQLNPFSGHIGSKEWNMGARDGICEAYRIAERVRIEKKIPRSEVTGEIASDYLFNVLGELQKFAEVRAAKGYGRYRWIWYLRRLPEEVFSGRLATTAPYDRKLAVVLATRGAGQDLAIGSADERRMFPTDGTVAKRVGWICGFTTAVAQIHVDARVIGKGGTLSFSLAIPGLSFPVFRSLQDDDLRQRIRAFDERNEHQTLFSGLGVPMDLSGGSNTSNEPALFLIHATGQADLLDVQIDEGTKCAVLIRYHPSLMAVSEMKSLLSDPAVAAAIPWSHEIPTLITLLYIALIIFGRSDISRINLFQTGYILVVRRDLDEACRKVRSEINELSTMLKLFAPEHSDTPLSNQILAMEGTPWPLVAGPIAFLVDETLIGIDICNATQRLFAHLQFPRINGEPANVRAVAFERQVQAAIDETAWAPPPEVRKLIGHHFKRNGKYVGEIDAFGALDRTLLLVSCKSVIYTAEHDQGVYSVVRNTRTMLEEAAEACAEMEQLLLQFPTNGQEYDLSLYDTIVSIIVTPHVMYVQEPLLSQTVFDGLRKYCGFEEFRNWLRGFPATP
jgi:hypothetical protein